MKHPPRLRLAHLPTPIQKLERLSAELNKELYIWRDDLTGFVESGNKIRKLEFLLADALARGATRVITSGGRQSNHARAACFAARRQGLEVALVLRNPKGGGEEPPTANFLLDQIAGADLHFISYEQYLAEGASYEKALEQTAQKYRERGETPYLIHEGGSMPLGCFGYIAAVEEMLPTWREVAGSKAPDALFFAEGSGGTHAGLHIGYGLSGLDLRRLWPINICDTADYFLRKVGRLVEDTAREFNLDVPDRTMQVLDGHVGGGFGVNTDEDLKFYLKIARQEGILLDPNYTGKAFQGMLRELRKSPDRFGEKILFLHTGGLFSIFAIQDRFAHIIAAEA